MPTLEQLLALGASENNNDILCTIIPSTRVIEVPEDAVLGVESDQQAQRIYFRCPRIVGDNVDLLQYQLCVNYENANGEKDRYIIEDAEEDTSVSDYISFSWLLSRKVTKYTGNVQFIVCALNTLSDGTIKNEWNTTLATAIVLQGLEPDADTEPTKEDIDVVTQLLALTKQTTEQNIIDVEATGATQTERVNTAGTTQYNRVNAEGTTQYDKVVQAGTTQTNKVNVEGGKQFNRVVEAGNNQLAMFEEIVNNVDVTKENILAVATKEKTELTNYVQLKDSTNFVISKLKMYGKSTQQTYTGSNLLDIESPVVLNGATAELQGNALILTIETTHVWTNAIFLIPNSDELLGKEITFGVEGISTESDYAGFSIRYFNKETNVQTPVELGTITKDITRITAILPSVYPDGYNSFACSFYANGNASGIGKRATFVKPYIILGNKTDYLSSYEPYVGGKPSPNMEYPQPIESVGKMPTNILDLDSFVPYNCKITSIDNNTGTIRFSYTDTKECVIQATIPNGIVKTLVGKRLYISYGFQIISGTASKLIQYRIVHNDGTPDTYPNWDSIVNVGDNIDYILINVFGIRSSSIASGEVEYSNLMLSACPLFSDIQIYVPYANPLKYVVKALFKNRNLIVDYNKNMNLYKKFRCNINWHNNRLTVMTNNTGDTFCYMAVYLGSSELLGKTVTYGYDKAVSIKNDSLSERIRMAIFGYSKEGVINVYDSVEGQTGRVSKVFKLPDKFQNNERCFVALFYATVNNATESQTTYYNPFVVVNDGNDKIGANSIEDWNVGEYNQAQIVLDEPLRGIGEYRDYIDKIDGEYVVIRKCMKLIIDETTKIDKLNLEDGSERYVVSYRADNVNFKRASMYTNGEITVAKSDSFFLGKVGETGVVGQEHLNKFGISYINNESVGNYFALYMRDEGEPLAEFKQKLEIHPVEFILPVEEEVVSFLSDEVQYTMLKLETYYGVSNIFMNVDAETQLEYCVDNVLYIGKMLSALQAQTLESEVNNNGY